MTDTTASAKNSGIPALTAWRTVTVLAAIALAIAIVLLLLREPETVVRDVPSAETGEPTQEMLDDVARLDDESERVSDETLEVLRLVADYECPPGTAPEDEARLNALKEKAQEMLVRLGYQPVPQVAPEAAPAAVRPSIPPSAEAPTPTPATGTASALTVGDLSSLLEKAVVFLIPLNETGPPVTGTGFFVGPDLVVTNRHVIEKAGPGGVAVISKSLGRMVKSRIIAASAPGRPGDPDFALLRTEQPVAPAILTVSEQHNKLMDVLVAGFPGLALGTDAGFRRLIGGDTSAAPDMHQNSGEIRSTQNLGKVSSIIHTADVLGGYSGGPLIDFCGRAVGINTFIQVDEKQSSKFNTALAAANLVSFLDRNNVRPTVDQRSCNTR